MANSKTYSQMLLDEFTSICRDNHVDFQVVWGPQELGTGVLMSPAGAKKFLAATGNLPENRVVESWANSSVYPDETVRYVGVDSTSYNILDFDNYANHGVFVEINIARNKSDSLSGKHDAVIENMLKRTAKGFSKPGQVKMQQMQEMVYKRALKKAGSLGNLKKECLQKILNGPDVKITEDSASKFKYKKYNADYVRSCIVEENINSADLFADKSFVDAISGQINEARKLRQDIDVFKKSGRSNMKIAENAWKTVCRIDEEIKGGKA